jgi:hypothetical protein
MGGLVVLLRSRDFSFQDILERYEPFVVDNGQQPDLIADFERFTAIGPTEDTGTHWLRSQLEDRARWYCAGLPDVENVVRQKVEASLGFLSYPPLADCLQAYHPRTGRWQYWGLSTSGAWFLDRDMVRARVFVDGERIEGGEPPLRGYYFFLLRSLLARHQGIILHAAAVVNGDGAYLFLGPSGSGKTTLSLAAKSLGWAVLADDRVIFRRVADGEFRAYATPWNMDRKAWQGSFGQRPASAPIRSTFYVHAGRTDHCSRLSPVVAAATMTEESQLAIRRVGSRDAAGLLGLLTELSSRVPFYQLWFSRADATLGRIAELDGRGEKGT